MGPVRVFPKHPLSHEDRAQQIKAAKLMLVNSGKLVGKVYAVDDESIAFTNTHQQPMTAYIVRTDDDEAWTLSPLVVAGWPVTTD